jgi:mono/diheme cytochrome c family protein
MSPLNEGWKARLDRRYKELKELGESFFPYTIAKDVVACAVVFAVICGLALWRGAELEPMADPLVTDYNPRPEWYFLFAFELLKYFPGWLEAFATVIVPALAAAALLFLPFIDRGPRRHPLDRPVVVSAGILLMAGILFLSVKGALAPQVNPNGDYDPQAQAGKRLFSELRCDSCHSVGGVGGTVGPALDTEGRRHNKEWLVAHSRDPRKMTAGSSMPNYGLLDDEEESLAAYMTSLGGGAYSPKAPGLFKENCASCHHIGRVGDPGGVDLTDVGQRRQAGWVERYVTDPSKLNPDAAMPSFSDNLGKDDIKDLAQYLAAQQGQGDGAVEKKKARKK